MIRQLDALKSTLSEVQAQTAPALVGHDPVLRIEARLTRIEASLAKILAYLASETSGIADYPDPNLGVQ